MTNKQACERAVRRLREIGYPASLWTSDSGKRFAVVVDYQAADNLIRVQGHAREGLSREDLPDPDKLELLADWIDSKYPDDPNPDVQADLRRWAQSLRGWLASPAPERERSTRRGRSSMTGREGSH